MPTTEKQPRGAAVRKKILEAAEELLLEKDGQQISLDELLVKANVARNTLYHHFGSLDNAVEEALLQGFARQVAQDSQAISAALSGCKDKASFRQALTAITKATQSPDRAIRRMLRVRVLALAGTRPHILERVAVTQATLTYHLTEAFTAAQDKGFVRSDFPARTGAQFIQAYTLGRVLLDIEPHDASSENDWIDFIDHIMENALLE